MLSDVSPSCLCARIARGAPRVTLSAVVARHPRSDAYQSRSHSARIPQIIKNWRESSTEGLAVLFFLLSLTGNFTYGASLLSFASSWSDLIKYIPWLLGSAGTMVEDFIIFAQFRAYSARPQAKNSSVA